MPELVAWLLGGALGIALLVLWSGALDSVGKGTVTMPIATILPLVLEALKMAPQLVSTGREVVDGAKQIWAAVTAENPPTADQQAEYDAALDAAHRALQNS
jgi:hypothetical protein